MAKLTSTKIQLDQDEIRDVTGDLINDIQTLRRTVSMLTTHFRAAYRNILPEEIPELSSKVVRKLADLDLQLDGVIKEAIETEEELVATLKEERYDPDANPYEGMTKAEFDEEMFGQAADYYYERYKDK